MFAVDIFPTGNMTSHSSFNFIYCWFVCQKDYRKNNHQILMKPSGRVFHRPRKNQLNFGADPSEGME